jgi:hypothetical protein
MFFTDYKTGTNTPAIQQKIAGNKFFNHSGEGYFFDGRENGANNRTPYTQHGPNDTTDAETTEVPPQAIPAQGNPQPDQLTDGPVVSDIKLVKNMGDKPITGFGAALCCGANEDMPGPYNDTVNGPVANSHQVHFTLSAGKSDDLVVVRMINRKSVRGGQNLDKKGNDGPPADEIKRPDKQTLVVADIPGWCTGTPQKAAGICGVPFQNSHFPITYNADFVLAVYDPLTKKTSSINYTVNISKNSISDAAPKNEVVETGRKI